MGRALVAEHTTRVHANLKGIVVIKQGPGFIERLSAYGVLLSRDETAFSTRRGMKHT